MMTIVVWKRTVQCRNRRPLQSAKLCARLRGHRDGIRRAAAELDTKREHAVAVDGHRIGTIVRKRHRCAACESRHRSADLKRAGSRTTAATAGKNKQRECNNDTPLHRLYSLSKRPFRAPSESQTRRRNDANMASNDRSSNPKAPPPLD